MPRSAPGQRVASGDLDQHGRQVPRDARLDDGELEIPAFLRRQAN
jgi:cell division protein FtsZ